MTQTASINDKILQLIEALKLNNNSFSKRIGVAPSVIGNITGGRKGKPSFELLEKIGVAFPEVSLEWLIRGEGEMFRGETGEIECQKQLRMLTAKYNDLEQDFERATAQIQRLKKIE
jgi:transcriptional regulator with XRE-family HTH domain